PPVHCLLALRSPWNPVSIWPTTAASELRTRWSSAIRPPTYSPGSPKNWRSSRRTTERGIDRRLQEWACPADRRPAVADRRVPTRQAREGSGLRADQTEERVVRQGRRQDL